MLSLEECYWQLPTNWIEIHSAWLLELIHPGSSSLSELYTCSSNRKQVSPGQHCRKTILALECFFEINIVSGRRFNMSCWLYLQFYSLCVFLIFFFLWWAFSHAIWWISAVLSISWVSLAEMPLIFRLAVHTALWAWKWHTVAIKRKFMDPKWWLIKTN